MGIVASLAAAPAAYDIITDERKRDQERLVEEEEHIRKIKEAELYKLGDVELDLIKRLSKEITAVEENIPSVVRFREGQTQVHDVKRVYLTGEYKQKYKIISENNYLNSPVKSAQYRIYPTLEIGGRKVKSAYPNVRIRNATREPHQHIYTPSIFIQNNMNNNPLRSNIISSSEQGALTVYNNRSYSLNSNLNTPFRSPIKDGIILKDTNKARDQNYRYTHRIE